MFASASISVAPAKKKRAKVDPTTTNKDYSGDLAEFLKAVDDYKTLLGRRFMSNSEVFEMIRKLGYTKQVVGS